MDKPSPYAGPRAYRRGEELHGRDQETLELLRLVLAERIVLLYSPSGAGKTSLLTAKMAPRLEAEDFHVLGPARVSDPRGGQVAAGDRGRQGEVEFAPQASHTPQRETAAVNPYTASLISYWEEGRPNPDSTPRLDKLAGIDLAGYLTQRSWIRSDPRPTVLILDQFEEIFTLNPWDLQPKKEFFLQLGRALQDRDRWAIIAMREEHIAALDPYLDFVPTRFATRYRLELLSPEYAREAIEGPARSLEVSYRPEALDRMIAELTAVRETGGEIYHTAYVEPLHLQVVCDRLWQRLPDGTTEVTLDLFDTAGTVGEALQSYYRDAVQAVARTSDAIETNCDEKRIRDWFVNELISPTGLRNQLQCGETTTGGLPNPLVKAFEARYLVRSELRRGTVWYEIAHDRLIQTIKADNLAWYESQPELRLLGNQVKRWQDHLDAGRSAQADAELFAGEFLNRIEEWAKRNGPSLSRIDRRFLNACRERRRRDEEKARTAKLMRRAWLAVALVVVCSALVVAYFQWDKSEMEKKTAKQARERSEQLQVATTEARVHRLLADAAAVRWRQGNHELAVLLSLEAEKYARSISISSKVTARIQENLLNTVALRPFTLSPELAAMRRSSWEPGQMAFSPDGQFMALGSRQNEVEIVPLRADPPDCSRPLIRTDGAIRALNFSASGRYLVAVTGSGAELFKTEDLGCAARPDQYLIPNLLAPSIGASGPFCTAAADDSLLFLAQPGGGIKRWRMVNGALVLDGHLGKGGNPANPGDAVETAMACDPGGGWVAVGNKSGGITIWTPAAPNPNKSYFFQNSLNAWPADIGEDFKFLAATLDYGVSELLPWPEANHLIAVFRHGPPALIALPVGADQEPSLLYLRPTHCSEEKLELLAALGRAGRMLAHKPKLLQAVFDAGRQRLVVGGERHIGEWDLRVCSMDLCTENEADRDQSRPPQQLFAQYSESRASHAPIAALGSVRAGEITAEADVELNIRLMLMNGLGNVGSSHNPIRIEGNEGGPGVLYSLRFLPDGRTLAVGGSKYLTFMDVSSEDLKLSRAASLPCLPRSIRAMALSPEGRHLALITSRNVQRNPICLASSAWGRDAVVLMDLTRESGAGSPGEPEILQAGESEGMWSAAWANGPWTGGRNLLAVGDYGNRVWIWMWEAGAATPTDSTPRELPLNPRSAVRALAFHPSEPYLAIGTDDGSLELWWLQLDPNGRVRAEILQNPAWSQRGPIRALAWSPDGDALVYGNGSGTIGLVPTTNLKSGFWEESYHAFAHSMGVTALVFGDSPALGTASVGGPDGRLRGALASAGSDGKVKLWDLQNEDAGSRVSLELRLTLEGPRAEAQSVAFSPDGRLIAAGDAKGHVHLWRTELAPLLEDACAAMRRNLTLGEWSQYVGGNVPYEQTCQNLPPAPRLSPITPH